MGVIIPFLNQSSEPRAPSAGAHREPTSLDLMVIAENSGGDVVSPSQPGDRLLPWLRVNAWPVVAIFLTGIGTAGVVFILSGVAWIALRTILLLLSPHV